MDRAGTSEAKEIGEKIKYFRKQKNWTQEVLAHEAGTSASAICNIENGNRKLSVEVLCNIAKALRRELSDFEPESVYNSSECGDEINEVLNNISHIYRGIDPDKQSTMLDILQSIAGSYAKF